MRFLWPNKPNPNPTTLTRFGRVLHWIAACFALPTLAFFVISGVWGLVLMTRGPQLVHSSYGNYTYMEVPGANQAGVVTCLVSSDHR